MRRDVDSVEMTHEKIPGRSIHVAPCAVPHHERAGWRTVAVPVSLERATDQEQNETENEA